MKKIILIAMMLMAMVGCTRIETGEVGLRKNFSKQIETSELQPGTFNQTISSDVLVFPVKQIALNVTKLTPMTLDKSIMADLDFVLIYNINPSAVSSLYTTKSHALNTIDSAGDTLLMYNYMMTVASSAASKAINKYNALDVPSNQKALEDDIADSVRTALKDEKLDTSITIDQVQIKHMQLNAGIIASAQSVITAQNSLNAKKIELQTAQIEAQRQDVLAQPSNIAYMHAQSELNISEGVKEGKVNTVLIPHNLTMFGSK
jgi:regulator of protease activity HflC (stomatin/prohibitin superfamily)